AAPGSRGGRGQNVACRCGAEKPSMSAVVWLWRYLSTKAATPFSLSARATSQPSFSIDSERKPPPGATITAAPVALAGSGRNGVRVASVTLRANTLPYCLCQTSGFFASGSGPVGSLIASGWTGVAIGVMRSSSAWAGARPAPITNRASRRGPQPRRRVCLAYLAGECRGIAGLPLSSVDVLLPAHRQPRKDAAAVGVAMGDAGCGARASIRQQCVRFRRYRKIAGSHIHFEIAVAVACGYPLASFPRVAEGIPGGVE